MFRRCLLSMILCLFAAPVTGVAADADGDDELSGAHLFSFESIDGGALPLSQFSGRPVLVVNTASMCGFTHQYDGLQALYDTYRDRGLVVVGVPSDDFGGQEFATEKEVKHFCAVNFNLTLPMTTITVVRGRKAHPFYAWAMDKLGAAKAPKWNFHKYLVAPDGTLAGAYSHRTEPLAPKLTNAIEAYLPASTH